MVSPPAAVINLRHWSNGRKHCTFVYLELPRRRRISRDRLAAKLGRGSAKRLKRGGPVNRDLVADHSHVEGVPLADGAVGIDERLLARGVALVVPQAAGADTLVDGEAAGEGLGVPDLHLRLAAQVDATVALGWNLPVAVEF